MKKWGEKLVSLIYGMALHVRVASKRTVTFTSKLVSRKSDYKKTFSFSWKSEGRF